jgi:outer membrane lipase/esterase
VVKQIANHLDLFKKFEETDLILVFAGSNDVFVQFGAFAANAAVIAADPTLSTEQRSAALLSAQLAAQGEMKKAALELSSYVRDQILANGGKYVAVWNLPDIAVTPFGQALPDNVRPVLTTLVDTFNLWLRDGLTGQPVKIVDINSTVRDVQLDPAKYGISNNETPACDADKIEVLTSGRVTSGSSLFCNATPGAPYNTLRTGADVDTWLWADDVHPTKKGHQLISDDAVRALTSFGWL